MLFSHMYVSIMLKIVPAYFAKPYIQVVMEHLDKKMYITLLILYC